MDISLLEKYDSQKMYQVYDDWPNLARKAFDANLESINFENINHIVFVGMGGSGAIGDLFSSILSKTNIHVSVVKGYILPKTVDKNTLVVVISVSGNTMETLVVLNSAHNLDCKIIVFCSGGKMEQYCIDEKIDFRKINFTHSPRASFITFAYSILNVLQNILPIHENDVISSIDSLFTIQKEISSNNLIDSNPAIHLARWITGIPLIYYPFGLSSVATRFKNSLQENSKIHVISEDIVESCHNGIVSWEKQSVVQPILLQGTNDHVKTKERWKLIKNYFDEKNIEYFEIFSVNGNMLTKIINLIYLLDYTTIYHAVLSEINPSTVDSINYIKNRLQN